MQIKRLKMTNFMRIKNAELDDLHTKGVMGILAKGIDDDKRSNYLGKTSTLEASRYALTGKSRASKAAQLIHFGEDQMQVELDLIDDEGVIYPIRRGVDSKGKGLLEVGFGDKKREGQQIINDLLGIDEKDFDLTFFFQQADINGFMSLGSAEQKKMMMKWQKNDHWQEKEKAVNEDIKKYKEKIKEEEIILRNLELNIGNVTDIESNIFLIKEDLDNKQNDLKRCKAKLEEFSNKSSVSESEYNRLLKRSSSLSDSIDKHVTYLNKVESTYVKMDNLQDELANSNMGIIDKRIEDSFELCNKLQNEGVNLESKISKIKNAGSGLCPILDESCDRLKLSKEQIDKMDTDLAAIKDKKLSASLVLHELKEEKKSYSGMLDEFKKLELFVSKEETTIELKKSLTSELEEISVSIENYDPDFHQNKSKITDLADNLEYEISDLKDELSILNHKFGEYEKNEEKIEELRSSLIKRNTILSDLQYVSFTFGKNGIPSLEIENSFQEIEEEINYILEEIDETLSIECKPDRELKSWEELCLSCGTKFEKNTKKHVCKKCGTPRRKKRKDELQLNIVQSDNEMSFEMCSGGLKTITSLCVRTALTMLLKRQNGTNLNVLFLDEIDSALDESNKEKIKKIVSQVFIKKLGFKQIFWISHDKTISDSVPHTILVKGYEDHSELVWM